jgi:hypothetical protein
MVGTAVAVPAHRPTGATVESTGVAARAAVASAWRRSGSWAWLDVLTTALAAPIAGLPIFMVKVGFDFKETTMRLDIYRRADTDGTLSYLAVPESRNIPEEATNTDWEIEARAFEVQDDAEQLPDYDIDNVTGQIDEKGYAITSVQH